MTFGSKPLLKFSSSDERATLLPLNIEFTPKRKTKRAFNKSKKTVFKSNKIKVVKGTVALRIPGYRGVQYLPVSELLLPQYKLKLAVQKVLSKKKPKQRRKKVTLKNNNKTWVTKDLNLPKSHIPGE